MEIVQHNSVQDIDELQEIEELAVKIAHSTALETISSGTAGEPTVHDTHVLLISTKISGT